MATPSFNPWRKIAEIWTTRILNWRKIPVYDYVARYDDDRYEDEIQNDPEVLAALHEMTMFRDRTGFAAALPPLTQDLLSGLASKGLERFRRRPRRAGILWLVPILIGFLIALAVPIAVSKIINDEIYFISKISTTVVTLYMFIPYMYGGYLSLEMLWKFAETRLIHPLAPMIFVILAFAPPVQTVSKELWYKAISGIFGLIILTFFIFALSLRKKHLLRKIAADVPNRTRGTDEDEQRFEAARKASEDCFGNALDTIVKREKGTSKIEVSMMKRDQTSFRKDSLATFRAAVQMYGAPESTPRRSLMDNIRLTFAVNDPFWQTHHHPFPKLPVLLTEIGFMGSQLYIYRDYLATFIDTVVTQTRVIIKLGRLVFERREPVEAALGEFSRLVAGAILGFFLLGIPYSRLGRAWVQGRNMIYLCLGLTAIKLLFSNLVAPVVEIFGLLLFIVFRAIWVFGVSVYRYVRPSRPAM